MKLETFFALDHSPMGRLKRAKANQKALWNIWFPQQDEGVLLYLSLIVKCTKAACYGISKDYVMEWHRLSWQDHTQGYSVTSRSLNSLNDANLQA